MLSTKTQVFDFCIRQLFTIQSSDAFCRICDCLLQSQSEDVRGSIKNLKNKTPKVLQIEGEGEDYVSDLLVPPK